MWCNKHWYIFVGNCLPCARLLFHYPYYTLSNICTVISLASLTPTAAVRAYCCRRSLEKYAFKCILFIGAIEWEPSFSSFLQHVNYTRTKCIHDSIKQYQTLRDFQRHIMKGTVIKRLSRAERKNSRRSKEKRSFCVFNIPLRFRILVVLFPRTIT